MAQPKSQSKTIRLEANEAIQIEQFLAKNPFFDFSTLARLAIRQFVENPNFVIHPVQPAEVIRSTDGPNQYRRT